MGERVADDETIGSGFALFFGMVAVRRGRLTARAMEPSGEGA
jgi:hypothetical protein